MDFCDANGIDFVFGLAGNDVLRRLVEPIADDVRVRRAKAKRQRSAATPRRATARSRGMLIGASSRGLKPPRRVSISAMW